MRKRYWVDIPDEEGLVAVDAYYVVVMDNGELVFMDDSKQIIAAFSNWNNMMDDQTSEIKDET